MQIVLRLRPGDLLAFKKSLVVGRCDNLAISCAAIVHRAYNLSLCTKLFAQIDHISRTMSGPLHLDNLYTCRDTIWRDRVMP